VKDLIANWVEARKFEHDDGRWQRINQYGDFIGPIYATEMELDDVLWTEGCSQGIYDLVGM